MLREGGGLIDLVKADNPLIFAAPTSISFPVNGGTVPVTITDAGGGSGSWSVSIAAPAPRPGRLVSAAGSISAPGDLSISRHRRRGRAERQRDRVRRPVARVGYATDPLLGRGRPSAASHRAVQAAHAAGDLHRDDRGRREEGHPLPLPDRGRRLLPGARGRLPGADHRTDRELRRRRRSPAHAVPHVVFAGDENHLAGFAALPRTSTPTSRASAPTARSPASSSPRPEPTTSSSTPAPPARQARSPSASGSTTRPRRPPRRLDPRQTITVSITDAGAGVDPQSISASVDGHNVVAPLPRRPAVLQASPGRHL